MKQFLIAVTFVVAILSSASAAQLTIATFNVESGGASHPHIIARLKDTPRVDVWVFQEVPGKFWIQEFAHALSQAHLTTYDGRLGMTGIYPAINFDDDRLALIFDTARVQLLKVSNLTESLAAQCGARRSRAPLVAKFKHLATGKNFRVINNHFQRNEAFNTCQATFLHAWGRNKRLPMIVLGDFNFDLNVSTGRHRPGLDEMQKDGVFAWVKPDNFQPTHCGRHKSHLDFVFLGGNVTTWQSKTEILFTDDALYCSTPAESDHFPLLLTVQID